MLRVNRRPRPAPLWTRPGDMPEMIYELLLRRGIESREAAEAFLHPDRAQIRDPFLLPDMDRAASRVREAIERHQKICLYGDYDADGVSATAIMLLALRRLGADCEAYLPSRHEEGYGLNERAVRAIAEKFDLLVTLDCGVTAVELVALARSLGLDCVVTDHHTPGDALPDCPVVDPLLGGYPFPGLCGAGVAFKLALALLGEKAMEWIDLAAFATVADIVPLADENRAIVYLGLQKINASPRPGLRALIDAAGLADKPIGAGQIGYQLAPRINAGGRMGDALRALNLFTADALSDAAPVARELEAENKSRQSEQTRILESAEKKLEGFDFIRHRAIVLWGEDWNSGVIGLAASRLTDEYGYPSVMLARKGEFYTGSCRSVPGIDIHQALTRVSPLLDRFGGHKQAAGLTIEAGKLPLLQDALDEAIRAISKPSDLVPLVNVDMELPVSALDLESLRTLEKLEPTGMGNPAPLFEATATVTGARAVGQGGAHLKLSLSDGLGRADGIWFQAGSRISELANETIRVSYAASVNRWMNRETPQFQVRAALPDSFETLKARYRAKETELHCLYLTNLLYNEREFISGTVGADEARAYLLSAPQGTLMYGASDELLSLPGADVFFGAWPGDPRRFTSYCVCALGAPPEGYERLILWDAPPFALPFEPKGELVWTGRGAGWFSALPGVDEARAVFKVSRSPLSGKGMVDLCERLAARAGLCAETVCAGLCVLERLGLVTDSWRSGLLTPLPTRKCDIEGDYLFNKFARMRATVR